MAHKLHAEKNNFHLNDSLVIGLEKVRNFSELLFDGERLAGRRI
jgi:hypothetical protein